MKNINKNDDTLTIAQKVFDSSIQSLNHTRKLLTKGESKQSN